MQPRNRLQRVYLAEEITKETPVKFKAHRLDGAPTAYIIIKPDRDNPGRAFIDAPRRCSMPPAEMIRMANYLADLIEAGEQAA